MTIETMTSQWRLALLIDPIGGKQIVVSSADSRYYLGIKYIRKKRKNLIDLVERYKLLYTNGSIFGIASLSLNYSGHHSRH